MKRSLVIGMLALGIGASAIGGPALAGPLMAGRHGGMHGPGPGMMFPMLLRTLDLTPTQRQQIADIMQRHRTNVEPVFKDLRAAHDDLARKLFAPGTVTAADLAPGIARLGQLKQQMLQEWAQAALETRAVLTPAQLAKAADVKQRLDALHGEMQQLLGPTPTPSTDGPED